MALAASRVPIRPFRFGFNDKTACRGDEWAKRVQRLESARRLVNVPVVVTPWTDVVHVE
jgi:hypothetical protein